MRLATVFFYLKTWIKLKAVTIVRGKLSRIDSDRQL